MNMQEWQQQIWDCPNMNPTAVAICLAIGSHGNWSESQTVWPSRQRIASMVNVSRETVGKYMTALEEQGWLKVVRILKDNVREYELCKPEVVVVYGNLAVKNRGSNVNQVVVDVDEVVENYDKQVVVDDGLGCLELRQELTKNLPEELSNELSKKSTDSDEPVLLTDEDEKLGEVAVFNRLEQVDSYINAIRHLPLTLEQKKQIRELCLNPKWYVKESRPNFRTQAAIKEVLVNE